MVGFWSAKETLLSGNEKRQSGTLPLRTREKIEHEHEFKRTNAKRQPR